jgi:hypothetical protein
MKNRKIIYYLTGVVVVIILVQIYSEVYIKYLQVRPYPGTAMMTSLSDFSLQHFWSLLINIFMGMIFALEGFIKSMKMPGKWHLDVKRLIIIGVPLLFLSIEYFDFIILQEVFDRNNFSLAAPARESFLRFLLGYIILSSIYKVKNDKDDIKMT